MRRAVVLFAREPVPGRVKTRLAAGVGAKGAARLYEAFLDDLSEALPRPDRWRAVLACAEPSPGPGLTSRFRPPWELWAQGDGDLGDRLTRMLVRALAEGAEAALAAGSDAPTLDAEVVGRAFSALSEGSDVVACPSPDGGFALVGVGRGVDVPALFAGIRWSGPDAFRDLVAAAERIGSTIRTLEAVPDVDVARDLERLRDLLTDRPGVAPRTAAALASGAGT